MIATIAFPIGEKIHGIKLLRSIGGLGLKDAKELYEQKIEQSTQFSAERTHKMVTLMLTEAAYHQLFWEIKSSYFENFQLISCEDDPIEELEELDPSQTINYMPTETYLELMYTIQRCKAAVETLNVTGTTGVIISLNGVLDILDRAKGNLRRI